MIKDIIIYGGSFDPLHKGHVRVVDGLLSRNSGGEVWILPSANWLKRGSLLSLEERIECLNLVFKQPKVKILYWSVKWNTTSTQKVAEFLQEQFPQYRFSFALGEDVLETIHLWKDVNSLLETNSFILVTRSGYNLIQNPPTPEAKKLLSKSSILKVVTSEISSSEIRANPKNIENLIPKQILKIIRNKLE